MITMAIKKIERTRSSLRKKKYTRAFNWNCDEFNFKILKLRAIVVSLELCTNYLVVDSDVIKNTQQHVHLYNKHFLSIDPVLFAVQWRSPVRTAYVFCLVTIKGEGQNFEQ